MESIVSEKGLSDIHFLGPVSDLNESAPYIFASDIMLQPGYVGLVVNHAFSLGLPVITQAAPDDLPFHGPEVESIVHNQNGMIVDRDNHEAMQDAIDHVMQHQSAFSRNAISYTENNLTLDHLVDGLLSAIDRAETSKSA